MYSSKIKIAITGGISTGKTTVFNFIKKIFKNKAEYINLDEITREIYDNLEVKEFLNDNFNTDKREEISKIVFGDKKKLDKLSKYIHKKILFSMKEKIRKSEKKYIFVEFPLLYEINYQKHFDISILVYLDKKNQLKRLMKRNNISEEEALKRINSQMDIEEKKKMSKYIIYNKENREKLFLNTLDVIFFSIKVR